MAPRKSASASGRKSAAKAGGKDFTVGAIADFSKDEDLAAYREMLLIRRFEEKAGQLYGMGFIGGGAIFKNEEGSKGTATAASLWNTGAIGISVAYGRYEIAIILSFVGFLILQFSEPFKSKHKL